MHNRMIRILAPVVGLLLLMVFSFAFAGCSKDKPESAATPIPLDFSKAEQVHQDNAALPPSEDQNKIMEGVEGEGNQRCRQLCKKVCVRGRQCNVPNFANLRRCAKSCLQACNANMVPESFDDCIKPDSKCTEVVDCLKKLREHVKEKQATQAQPPAADVPDGAPEVQ